MKRYRPKRDRKNERGQILILLACAMVGLLLCSALAVDVGFAYVTKAKLVKAVDAACLIGMTNLAQGQTTAQTLGTNAFTANYAVSPLDSSPPAVNISFSNSSGQEVVGATGTATIHTIFMGLLPGFQTLTVNASAQALRGTLAMTIVVDRSGSMALNGGQQAITAAVPTFVNYFNNTVDEVALVSFASGATTDVTIAHQFQTPITNAINAMSFTGGTFGLGGLTLAKAQEDSVIHTQGQNLVKVVVYFTDGLVNEIQDTFNCTTQWGATLYNYGGYDSGSSVDFFVPSNGTDWGGLVSYNHQNVPPHSPSPPCGGVTTFTSQIDGSQKSFTRTNVTADAQYRSQQIATALRTDTNPGPPVYIYAIGLGSDPSLTFLQEIANDPASPTYNSSQHVGEAVLAPDCSSPNSPLCTQELQQVFQTIAAKVLLRLTQ